VEAKIPTRMGDGYMVELTRSELRADLEDATREAARKAKVPPLGPDELSHLLDIYASRAAFTAVDIGDQVVLSCDGGGSKMTGTDLQDLLESEQRLGQDILELWHIEYSYKAIKTILPFQQQVMQNCQLMMTAPVQYGAQPNLAFYSKPDGPADNWFELLPRGDIAGARAAIDVAMDHATKDFIYVGEGMLDAGADGMDFDTTGGAGDADFFSTLRAVKHLRAKYPHAGIEVGMAGEFVIGVHGELEWDGRRLAGLWPKEQLEVCQDAGATIFGPAVNIRTAQILVRDFFAGGRLDQRRAADKDRSLLADDDRLVAHGRHIRPSRRAGPHDDRDLGNAHGREPGLIVEDTAEMFLIGKRSGLVRQKNASGIDQIDAGQPVLHGHFLGPDMLLDRHRKIGPALDGRVVGHDQDFAAVNDADPGDHAGPGGLVVIHVIGGQGTELEERRIAVKKLLQPFPDKELFSGLMELPVFLRAALLRFGQLLPVLGDDLLHLVEILLVLRTLGVDLAFDSKHGPCSL